MLLLLSKPVGSISLSICVPVPKLKLSLQGFLASGRRGRGRRGGRGGRGRYVPLSLVCIAISRSKFKNHPCRQRAFDAVACIPSLSMNAGKE